MLSFGSVRINLSASILIIVLTAALARTTTAASEPGKASQPQKAQKNAQSETSQQKESVSGASSLLEEDGNISGTGGGASASSVKIDQPASPESSSIATLSNVTAPAKKQFGASFFTRHDFATHSLYTNSLDGAVLNRATVKYNLSDTKSVSYSQDFTNKYPTGQVKNTDDQNRLLWHMSDGFFQYFDTSLAAFPGDIKMIGFMRAYVPTGESSRFENKRYSILMPYVELDKSVGKLDLDYELLGAYCVNSQDSFTNSKGQIEGNCDYGYETYVRAGYNLTPKVMFWVFTGLDDYWNRSVSGSTAAANGAYREVGYNVESGVRFKMTKQVSVSTSFVERVILSATGGPKDYAAAADFKNDANMSYRAMLSVSL